MSAERKKTFLQGAVILGAAGLLIKGLGAIFRIPLGNIIGDTGMGYYQTAYPVYVMLLILSSSGIPVALSRMISERTALGHYHDAFRVFRVTTMLLAIIGIVSSAFLFFGAGFLVNISKNPNAKLAMMAVAPALLFVPIMAAYRGFFQGQQDMHPTARSQIVEQLFRVFVGLSLSILLVKKGLEYAAAGASFGATAGAMAGLAAVLFIFWKRKKKTMELVENDGYRGNEDTKQILKSVLVIAIPITIGAAIMPIMNIIDLAVVMRRLQGIGFTMAEANSLYGQLTGFAGPLINIPQIMTQSIAMSMVPAIAAAYKRQDHPFLLHNVQLGLRVALFIGLPCGLGLLTMAHPIMDLLYPTKPESAAGAAGCLAILAVGVMFLAVVQTLTGILQGIGKQNIPVRNLCIGALCKVVLTYVLTGIPFLNVKGAAIGTAAAYAVAAVLNYIAVKKYVGVEFDKRVTFLRPVLSVAAMSLWVLICRLTVFPVVLGRMGAGMTANAVASIITIGSAVVVYVAALVVFRGITSEELKEVPRMGRVAGLLRKVGR